VAVFSLEYLLRIVAAREKVAFILSFHGLVTCSAIAPFFLAGSTRAGCGCCACCACCEC